VTGHFSGTEIAMTLVIGTACLFGITQSVRWKTSVSLLSALATTILFAVLQLAAFRVSLIPYIANLGGERYSIGNWLQNWVTSPLPTIRSEYAQSLNDVAKTSNESHLTFFPHRVFARPSTVPNSVFSCVPRIFGRTS
jgi:hypothetical protein